MEAELDTPDEVTDVVFKPDLTYKNKEKMVLRTISSLYKNIFGYISNIILHLPQMFYAVQ